MSGSLTVIAGGMFAGKSTELLRYLVRAAISRKAVQLFKPSLDTRYSKDRVVTHGGVSLEATPVTSSQDLLLALLPTTQVVGVDEAQFLDAGLPEVLDQLADKGLDVFVAGLNRDSRGQPFGPMPELLVRADEVVSVRAICVQCGQEASRSYRFASADPQVFLGASEAYEARCRACWKAGQNPPG